MDSGEDPSHPGAPRAGRGHAAEGYAARLGGWASAWRPPARRHQPGDPHRGRLHGLRPIVAITGQVGRAAIGTDAFQEADISGITHADHQAQLPGHQPDDIPRAIADAFHIAETGRPGPVLVDIPKGTPWWHRRVRLAPPGSTCRATSRRPPPPRQIREAAKRMMLAAKRPVLYVGGGGVIRARAARSCTQLAEMTGIPVVTTLMARAPSPTATACAWACPACTAPSRRSRPCRWPTCSSPSAPDSTTASPASWTPSRPRRR